MIRFRINRLRAWLIILPALGILAVAYWVNLAVEIPPQKTNGKQRHDPDFMVENFSATTLSKAGMPQYKMSAVKMLHYPDDDSTHIETIQLTSIYPDRPSMHISAKVGTISGKGDEVFLRDEVRLVRDAGATRSGMIFTTPFLHVIPELDLAKTDQGVTLKDGSHTVHARGMILDNQARTIKLLNQVKSEHAPATK